jgi:hypothetical protein
MLVVTRNAAAVAPDFAAVKNCATRPGALAAAVAGRAAIAAARAALNATNPALRPANTGPATVEPIASAAQVHVEHVIALKML